jgi:hypothetical protein
MAPNGTDEVPPVGGLLDDEAMILSPTDRDIAVAERLVIVHQAQEWTTGHFCRNDHARWPCRLHRWGMSVLLTAGWSEQDITELVRRAEAVDVPWA